MPAFGSNLSLNFHKNLWNELQLKSRLIAGVNHKTEGRAFEGKGWHVPCFQALIREEPIWIQNLSALRNAVKHPYFSETFPQKALGELKYSRWFPPALPDQSTNPLLFKLNLVSRTKVHEERASRLLCLILCQTYRYSNHKWQGQSQDGEIRQKNLPFEITLDCYLFGMRHWQWVIGQSSWDLAYCYECRPSLYFHEAVL